MSTRNRAGTWVIPEKEAEELMYGNINFNKLIKECLKSPLLTAPKPKLRYGRADVRAEILEEEKKRKEEELKKGILHRDLTMIFK